MLPFMFGKRPADRRDETDLEEILLDLQIRGALLAEYGSAEPPEGIFQRTLWKIQAWDVSGEAGARTRILKPIFGAMQALYGALRSAASGSAATRLMPAAMALILLVVVTDLNIQQLKGSATSLQFISSGNHNQASSMQDSAVSLGGGMVDPGWYEPDPDIRHFPRARVTDREQGNQSSKLDANGRESTAAPRSYSEEQTYLTSGPY